MIDRRLHTLRAVRHHGTVTAAAQALHFTPSAVSQQIRHLSREVGVELLEPHGRRVRLTDAALALVAHADALFARWEEARADLAEHADGVGGVLRICGFPTALAALIAPAVVQLGADHPMLSVHARESCGEALDLLLAGEGDIAVMSAAPDSPSLDDPAFDQQPLLDESLDLLVPADHPFARRAEVALRDAACEPWIVPSPGSSEQHELTLVACSTAGFTPTVVHQARDWAAIRALVAHRLGVALVPQLAEIKSDESVVRLPICSEPQPSRRILTCVRRGSSDHPTIQRGLKALQAASAARFPDSSLVAKAS